LVITYSFWRDETNLDYYASIFTRYGGAVQMGRIILQSIIDNGVNCWKLLINRSRQSAAKLTEKVNIVGKKVQRLIGEDTLPISLTRVPHIS